MATLIICDFVWFELKALMSGVFRSKCYKDSVDMRQRKHFLKFIGVKSSSTDCSDQNGHKVDLKKYTKTGLPASWYINKDFCTWSFKVSKCLI